MTELQIDRTACHMVRVFGLRAQGEAATLCAKIAARGDMEGMKCWTEIRRKICALQLVHGDCDELDKQRGKQQSEQHVARPSTRGAIHAVP